SIFVIRTSILRVASCSAYLLPSRLCTLPTSTFFPYTTLFRSQTNVILRDCTSRQRPVRIHCFLSFSYGRFESLFIGLQRVVVSRSEEHTSELQSRVDLVCRLLLEKKKKSIGQVVLSASPETQD